MFGICCLVVLLGIFTTVVTDSECGTQYCLRSSEERYCCNEDSLLRARCCKYSEYVSIMEDDFGESVTTVIVSLVVVFFLSIIACCVCCFCCPFCIIYKRKKRHGHIWRTTPPMTVINTSAPGYQTSYPVTQPGVLPQQPPTGSYPQQPGMSYPSQPAGSYPPQPAGSYPPQPAGSYPPQAAGSYPLQPAGGYPPQPAGGYPPQPAAAYPPQPASQSYPDAPPPYPGLERAPPPADAGGYEKQFAYNPNYSQSN